MSATPDTIESEARANDDCQSSGMIGESTQANKSIP